jgi:diacylglycerol kinase
METRPPNLRRTRRRAFADAFRGWKWLFTSQCHARLHLLAAVVVLAFGWSVGISRFEWLALIFAIALVLVAEAFNTALELLGDAITREQNPSIGRAKDLAAGAVLLAAVAAAVIGVLIFWPHLRALLPAWPRR